MTLGNERSSSQETKSLCDYYTYHSRPRMDNPQPQSPNTEHRRKKTRAVVAQAHPDLPANRATTSERASERATDRQTDMNLLPTLLRPRGPLSPLRFARQGCQLRSRCRQAGRIIAAGTRVLWMMRDRDRRTGDDRDQYRSSVWHGRLRGSRQAGMQQSHGA
ncbi:hypothetical protein EJ03DRAFT_81265 [Teratosphaeria nubilosa]|uniref:Uncharacterized protein n=1 Tax=Teratosphaeria nubilosa TaxID=161662 RepID=A0A6G1LDC0_9PEZI|nr:hypothetical protein EJ03DRAFT_81265 [Teratosphaeria nubilosa]